jgi:hypothetical protein
MIYSRPALILVWYENKLTERFLYVPLTPETVYKARKYLNEIQTVQQRTETHPAWKIPVALFVENNMFRIRFVEEH